MRRSFILRVGNRLTALRNRVEKSREAVENFVRIQEELIATKKGLTHAHAKERIEKVLSLNRSTLQTLKQSLAFAEAELERAEKQP
jgi:hypothetical protein